MEKLISLAKVAASGVLLLATLGLLWHERFDAGYQAASDVAADDHVRWFMSAAHGWFPDFIRTFLAIHANTPVSALAYLLVGCLIVAAIFFIPFLPSVAWRCLLSIIVVAGVSYDMIMYDIAGEMPGREITDTVLSNFMFGFEGTASAYAAKVVRNLCLAVPLIVVFVLPPPRWNGLGRMLPLGVVVVAFLGVAAILLKTKGHLAVFPSPVSSYINAYSVIAKQDKIVSPTVTYPSAPNPEFTKIVLVIDESVRGDYLSLNEPSLATTPYLAASAGMIANFGKASSATNCSLESRLVLRFGLSEKDIEGDLRLHARNRPTVWQYAKRSGFTTVYIDTFGRSGISPSNMLGSERSFIDENIVIGTQPYYERDPAVARKLRDLLDGPFPTFIIADKYGTHVPYDRMYPPQRNAFGANRDLPFSLSNKEELVKHYKNAVAWSVDSFFESLIGKGLPPGTLVLYTSDHGQSLSETPTLISHCSSARYAVQGEGIVPLFAITSDEKWKDMLRSAAFSNLDRSSHFEILPTLLMAMGYARPWVVRNFGPSLLDVVPPHKQRVFLTGNRVRKFQE